MKGIHLLNNPLKTILVLVLVVVSVITFGLILFLDHPDIGAHNEFISRWLSDDPDAKLYSLYFWVILVLSFFSKNMVIINFFSVLLLTTAVLAKYFISVFIFKRELWDETEIMNRKVRLWSRQIKVNDLILLLVFSVCIAENAIYKFSATMALGYIPVNTWHNSTTIFLMPFALWLFYKSYLFFINHKPNSNNIESLLELLLLTVFSVFIKPSYFFVFSIAFPFYYLLRFGFTKNFFLTGMVSALATFALLLVYRYVYVGSDSSVIISPFKAWGYWTENIPIALVSSIVFPLLFLVFYFKQTMKDYLLGYAWIHLLVALLIYSLLSETGTREIHANFSWQTIICNYILFFCTWLLFLRILIQKNRLESKDKILLASFIMHIVFGIVFLIKLPLYGPR